MAVSVTVNTFGGLICHAVAPIFFWQYIAESSFGMSLESHCEKQIRLFDKLCGYLPQKEGGCRKNGFTIFPTTLLTPQKVKEPQIITTWLIGVGG